MKKIEIKSRWNELETFVLYLFSGRQFRIQVQTLFTLYFLMKSRILDEHSTASCFEPQKTVTFQHIHSQNV